MKNRSCSRWLVPLGIVIAIVVCLAVVAWIYFGARAGAIDDRPLVLIQAPFNHAQLHVGDGVLVHATARSGSGLHRIELWADGDFVQAREAADGSAPTLLVLAGSWIPTEPGSHTLIVRAITANGVEGQATVTVDALPQSASDAGIYTAEEGDTLESIAGEYGITPDELSAANPGLGPGGPVPGETVVLPDDEAPASDGGTAGGEGGVPTGESGAPAGEGEDPPTPEGDAPSSFEFLWDYPLFEPLHAYDFSAGEPIGLQMEFLDLSTTASYEQLHCYIGFGDVAPLWYPDTDSDQATDESFVGESVAGGAMAWNIAGLSSDSVPVFLWPRNRSLPVSVSCVGIIGGGTDSVELGRWEDSIEPEMWTGASISGGAAGMYGFTFRITRIGMWDSGEVPKTDFDMTPPSNVYIDRSASMLRWDYLPRPDEDSLSGFRVYLNGSLQWMEPDRARGSLLPPEWVNPPCGTTYRFEVTAYIASRGGDRESVPAAADIQQSPEDCQREIAINFISLETFDLGGDGSHEDRHGDVGPAYGYFYANDQQVTFDGGDLGPGLDMPSGLSHNTTYALSEMSGDPAWQFSGAPSLLVSIPEGGAFEFGFHIMDQDSGNCHHSDDAGCDDLICEGFSMIYEEESVANELDEYHEGSITSEDERCRLSFQWGPAAGSPVGSGVEGDEPLPWLDLEEMHVDEDSGAVHLAVRNTGTAGWAARDLNIELQSRAGVSLGVYTWPAFTLEVGQRAVLEQADMRLAAPFDGCVMIDPYDTVVEAYERTGALYHNPLCPQLPDLIITGVTFDPSGGGRVRVAVRNVGEGDLDDRTLALQTFLPDGSPLFLDGFWRNASLAPGETRVFDLSGAGEAMRNRMNGGYSVVVNSDAAILETDAGNNSFNVVVSTRLWISLAYIHAPYHYRNQVEYHFDAYVVSGEARRQVADWNINQDIDWAGCGTHVEDCTLHFYEPTYSTYWFDIAGEESLEVTLTIENPGLHPLTYTGSETYSAPDWGGGPTFDYACAYHPNREPGAHVWVMDYYERGDWDVRFDICRENYEAP